MPSASERPPFAARALLFVPGSRAERFEKALASGADAVCIDLEDAVAPADKASARFATLAFLAARGDGAQVCVRVNGVRTAAGEADLQALAGCPVAPAAILLPKVESAEDVRVADAIAGANAGDPAWIPLVESALGLLRAPEIALQSPRLAALMFGGADFSAEVGCAFDWEPLLFARAQVVAAAALARVPAIDVPSLGIGEDAPLVAETRRAAALGFACKGAIHPRQVAPIQAALTPTPAQLQQARRIVEAAAGSVAGAFLVDGRMVDPPVLEAARRTLQRATA